MDYSVLASQADGLLRSFGATAKVSRAGIAVGSGAAVMVQSRAEDQTQPASSVLASTSQTARTLLLSGLAKEPLVGDTVLFDKVTYMVTAVERLRPATTTLLYKVEVIG